MKLTKRILSLVLAAALVLGSIAVAANAADYDGLTYEGSELAYKIEADKTEVKPGETVTFSVYMKNNYYIGASGGEMFLWTKGIFEAITEADIVASGIVSKTFNVTPNYAPPTGVYPSTHAYADWAGYISSRNANAGTVPEIISDFQLIYTITLKVLDDESLVGKTVTFEMPAGSIKSAAQSGRKGIIYQSIAKAVDNAAESIAYPSKVDLSAASVTIKVASAVEYCDYAALEAAVAKAPELAKEYYDAAEYAAWEAALAAANELLDAEPLVKEGDNQKTIDDAAALVESTLAALDARYVDLVGLTNAVADCKTPAYAAEYYDAAAYKAWQDAYAAAEKALVDYEGAPATKQGEVNNINNALVDAWLALEPAFVDLAKLNNAVDACDEVEYAADYYVAEDYAAWEQALAAAKAAQTSYDGQPATKQAEVDAIADELTAAYAKLNPSILDITALTNAIAASDEAEYAAEYYDAAEYAAWEKALADAQAGVTTYTGAANTAANQQAVAALAQALTDAFSALDARFVDASAIAEAITAYGAAEYAAEYYDAAEYAAWEAALAAANDADFEGKADTEANRAAVAKIADDLKVAYEALDARFVSLDELHNAIRDYHDPMMEPEWFDANEYAAWEAALADAQAGVTTYEGKADTEENRAAVAKLAEDLIAAYNELDARAVDVSDLEAAIAESVPAYGEEYYDAAAYADFTAAVEAGAAIVDEMGGGAAPDTEENRTTVAGAAEGIRAAFAKLVPAFVSYEKLEEAIAAYGTTENPKDAYVPETYAAYEAALAAAVEANDNRPEPLPAASEENQAVVDALADALEKAYNELVLAECHVISVTPLQESYNVGDTINFAVLVEGTAAKIQMIKESGVTSTYDKNTSAAVISVTDNGDGTETWVIARRIYEEKYTEYAKAKVGKVWDTGVTAYSLECTGEDAEVKSIEVTLNGEVVDTVLRSDLPTLTIVTGPAAKKVRLVDPVTRGTITLSTPASVNEDGTKVWTYTKRYNAVKLYDLDVYFVGSDGVSTDSGFDFELNVVDEIESQLPSTDKVEDAVLTAAVAKKRIVTGATQTFTYTTDKAAKAVRIIGANGKVLTTIKTATVEGDVATWTYEAIYHSIGDYAYTAEVLYGETWLADADSAVSFTVVY